MGRLIAGILQQKHVSETQMQPTGKPTLALSNFVSTLSFSRIPPAVAKKARICLLDYLGATFVGSHSKEAVLARQYIQKIGGNPHATVIGMNGNKSSMPLAALVNGITCHAYELDDAHRYATGLHPGATTIPAVLAVGEYLSASKEDLLTAIVAGYEVSGRVGRAINPSHRYRGFHSTGTVASFGAAAGAARILGLDTEKTAWALGIAGSMAGGIFEFLAEGSMNKLLHAGHAACNGVTAALLAQDGFTGPTSVLEGKEGFCRAFADEYNIHLLTESLGSHYEMDDTYFKRHASCGQAFGAIDAVLELRPTLSQKTSTIKRIKVRSFRAAAVLNEKQPDTIRKAKFSIPFVIALVLLKGSAGYFDFTQENLDNPEIIQLARLTEVYEDKEINDAFPAKRTAVVEIELDSGESLSRQVDIPRGMPENPLSQAELLEKFKSLTLDILGTGRQNRTAECVLNPENEESIYSLLKI